MAAVRFANQSRYDLAERQLRESLSENPEHGPSHSLLAICLARHKKTREALVAANEGLRLCPELPFAFYARACAHAHADRLASAKTDIDAAIALDPTLPEQFFMSAAICSDQRQARQSLEQAERGLALDPTHTGCASLRALALQRLGRKKEAEAAIGHALSLDPNNDFTHAAQGWRLVQAGQRPAARTHFLEALRINPENRWAEAGLASLSRFRSTVLWVIAIGVLRAIGAIAQSDSPGKLAAILAAALLFASAVGFGVLSLRDRIRNR
jgi:tetratricopeptide (TPR) repeat protein